MLAAWKIMPSLNGSSILGSLDTFSRMIRVKVAKALLAGCLRVSYQKGKIKIKIKTRKD